MAYAFAQTSRRWVSEAWRVNDRFDSSKPNIRDILLQLFSNCGTVEKISILKNVRCVDNGLNVDGLDRNGFNRICNECSRRDS